MPISHDAHTVKQFDVQLANLRNLVLEMGGLVEAQIHSAIKALNDEDVSAAREVIARDQIINGMQVKTDEDSVSLVALRQPLGSDLRLIMSLSKAVTDLERIGDEAEKIARMTVKIYDVANSPPSAKLLRDVTPMAKQAIDMLHGCLDALARLDVEEAVEVAKGDDELDQEYQSALRRLITYMMEDPRTIGNAIDVLFIIKALERIGDHSKNIAEYLIYLVKGKDVRHVRMEELVQDALEGE
ncbi:MAG TPA: phosphate signaling complex protein PhoU [Candidatus Competibacteraceae bacterium]|nr:phosphate signaling complex protein PhoU [Candidatus Competibacteraceae bacterium]